VNLQSAATTLFREAFEGRAEGNDYTWFVQGREAILPTLDEVDAMSASHSPGFGLPSLAAHAYHLRYILHWMNVPSGENQPEGDWESTWEKQVVTDVEWEVLRTEIRQRFDQAVAWMATNKEWPEENASLMFLAPLPHVAYHLGAMRVILSLVTKS
jgi:hypothetical protein